MLCIEIVGRVLLLVWCFWMVWVLASFGHQVSSRIAWRWERWLVRRERQHALHLRSIRTKRRQGPEGGKVVWRG